jgi:hypothetical protein
MKKAVQIIGVPVDLGQSLELYATQGSLPDWKSLVTKFMTRATSRSRFVNH